MDAINFRKAKASDAAALGTVHVLSWRETYVGLVPSELLDALSVEARSAMWHTVLDDPATYGGTAVFVAESQGQIVGFGACGWQRDLSLKAQGYDGEIGAIYVLRSHQRAGAGNALMTLMVRNLVDQGCSAVALWVLRENLSARAFYERFGGAVAGERAEEQSGAILTEVAYGWRDLSSLAP